MSAISTITKTGFSDHFEKSSESNKSSTCAGTLFQSYEKLCLEKNITSQLFPSDIEVLIETAEKIKYGKFALFKKDPKNSLSQCFLIGRSKDSFIQIGLMDPVKLGEGSFGVVNSVTFLKIDSSALQKIAIKRSSHEYNKNELLNEINILKILHADLDDIIGIQPLMLGTSITDSAPILASFSEIESIGYTMELFESDYQDFMKNIADPILKNFVHESVRQILENSQASFKQILSHFFQLASGLQFLQEKGILHTDITPRNVLIKKNQVKLADFGNAKNTNSGENPDPYDYPYMISPYKSVLEISLKNYNNPEERLEAIQIALEIDRYQLGDLFYRIFSWLSSGYRFTSTGCNMPYPLENHSRTETKFEYPRHFLPHFSDPKKTEANPRDFLTTVGNVHPELITLLKNMVAVNPIQRPSLEKIVNTLQGFSS